MGKKEFKKVITFRGDSTDRDNLKTLSQAWDCNMGEAIRTAIRTVVEMADTLNSELKPQEVKVASNEDVQVYRKKKS